MRPQPPPPQLLNAEHVLERVVEELAVRFAGIVSRETVERYVFESYAALARTAKVTTHLPSITRHFAADRLTALGRSQGKLSKPVPEVLFVCVQNAGRSQMAAALLHAVARGRVHVRSAGSAPAQTVHPTVVQAMAEIGIDVSHEFPKPLTDDVVRASDVVVTMGCGDACPLYAGKRYLDWGLPDPADRSLEEVRAVRDELDRRVRALLHDLVGTSEAVGGPSGADVAGPLSPAPPVPPSPEEPRP